MQFHIDSDAGTSISGWLLPDNPIAVPKLVAASPEHRREVELEANVLRTDLKDLGLHATGMAGFLIDQQLVPELATLADLEVREATTRLLVYRRFLQARHLERKLFLYGQHAMPQVPIETLLAKHFAQSYAAVEQHSYDTLFCIINMHHCNSIFISGRPRYFRYQQLLRERGFTIVSLLREPYEELAERLLFVRYASQSNAPPFAASYMTGLEPLVPVVKKMELADRDSIAAALKSLGSAQREAIANPFIKSIACQLDETAEAKHVSIALDNLASMDLVGVAARFDDFKATLRELIGTDVLGEAALSTVSWVPIIAEHLRRIPSIDGLLAHDLELYTHVSKALDRALGKGTQ
jgi:hypothetical protein